MYFVLKIMVFKWRESVPSDSLWISKLGISSHKLSNLKVVLATHDSSLFNNQTAKQHRLFIKFLRENIVSAHQQHSRVGGDSNEVLRAGAGREEEPRTPPSERREPEVEANETGPEGGSESESTECAENEVIADVYIRIFVKFQVNSMDALLALWREQVAEVKQIVGLARPGRHYLLEFLSHNPTLSKISQMTIVLNLTLSQFFSAIVNSKNFTRIQEHYDPEYSKQTGWLGSMFKAKKKFTDKCTHFDVNFEEACILSYVYSVLKNISLDKKRTQEIIITKRNLRKAWFCLIGTSANDSLPQALPPQQKPHLPDLDFGNLPLIRAQIQRPNSDHGALDQGELHQKTLHLHLNEVLGVLVDVIRNPSEYFPLEPEDQSEPVLSLLFPLPPSILFHFWDQVFTGFYDLSVFGSSRDLAQSFRVCGLDCLTQIMIPLFRATYSTSNQSRIGERLGYVLIQLIEILKQAELGRAGGSSFGKLEGRAHQAKWSTGKPRSPTRTR